jgi:S1-C subfamily serine protease
VKVIATQQQQQDPMQYLFGGAQAQVAIGSGFLLNYEGKPLVLTNYHVVANAEKVMVKLVDGRELEATKAVTEPASDIAAVTLKNPPADVQFATLGDSSKLQVGEWAIAIGNPYDYEHTVTVGVVSAMGYRQIGDNQLRNVIQTDAAINQGNSGGPLCNVAGDVIGINYRIFSPTGATVGIGFAIPINTAKQMLYFMTHGGVPWIGVQEPMPNSAGLAQFYGLGTDKGVVVASVTPGGPADKAGLKARDVILQVGATAVNDPQQLLDELLKHRIGDAIVLTVQRGKQQLAISVVAAAHPGQQPQ